MLLGPAAVVAACLLVMGCCKPDNKPVEIDAAASASATASAPLVEVPVDAEADSSDDAEANAAGACPDEMQLVGKRLCVDRWEAILVDKDTGERLSPYYPLNRTLAIKLEGEWKDKRKTLGNDQAKAMDVPALPEWQRTHDAEPKAVSRAGQTPNGYVSGNFARIACENAGKRLCKREEWRRACRGASDQQFPYGDHYKQGQCNVFRGNHPAAILHDDASMGHLDPRLLLVSDKEGPFLRKTGTTATCRSEWGKEALYDMVGNLDEWVDDPKGMFVGAFFSRARKDGCDAAITAHPNGYFDYSLGVRCCKDVGE